MGFFPQHFQPQTSNHKQSKQIKSKKNLQSELTYTQQWINDQVRYTYDYHISLPIPTSPANCHQTNMIIIQTKPFYGFCILELFFLTLFFSRSSRLIFQSSSAANEKRKEHQKSEEPKTLRFKPLHRSNPHRIKVPGDFACFVAALLILSEGIERRINGSLRKWNPATPKQRKLGLGFGDESGFSE